MKLKSFDRLKLDNTDDEIFYQNPRFVHHLGFSFRKRLTKLYSQYIKDNSVILDLMSSWVSHLPNNINYKKVIGHGLNEDELKANKKLNTFWIQNFNKNQKLPIDDSSIDVGLIVAGWQYLQYPEQISQELSRVIKPNSLLIISFSNRAFWSKSPNIWVNSSDNERIIYVRNVITNNGWTVENVFNEKTFETKFMGLYNHEGDPFFSLVSRNNKSNN